MGGLHLQRMVDVEKVRTLICVRGVLAGSRKNKFGKRLRDVRKPRDARLSFQLKKVGTGLPIVRKFGKMAERNIYVQRRRVPIKSEFPRLCVLHDEGTITARGEQWHKMAKKLVDIQNGGPDL